MPFQMIVLGLLTGWKRNHLEIAIAEGLSLAGLLLEHKRDIVNIGKTFGFVYSSQKDELNAKTVLQWLQESRPDLYVVFDESKEAKLWLSKQVKEIKELLFNGR